VSAPDKPREEIEITPEMIEAGAAVLDEYVIPGSGLLCTPTYGVERVYRAMEKIRLSHQRWR